MFLRPSISEHLLSILILDLDQSSVWLWKSWLKTAILEMLLFFFSLVRWLRSPLPFWLLISSVRFKGVFFCSQYAGLLIEILVVYIGMLVLWCLLSVPFDSTISCSSNLEKICCFYNLLSFPIFSLSGNFTIHILYESSCFLKFSLPFTIFLTFPLWFLRDFLRFIF